MSLLHIGFNFIVRTFGSRIAFTIPKLKYKNYSTTTLTPHRKIEFIQNENNNAHNLLQKLIPYQSFVLPHPRLRILENFTGSSTNINPDKAQTFQKLLVALFLQGNEHLENYSGTSASINSKESAELIASICGIIPKSSDMEIIDFLSILCLWLYVSSKEQNLLLLLTTLDKECCKRFPNWPIQQQLAVADIYYHVYASRNSHYTTKLINLLGNNLNTLSKPHLVYLLFQINLKRRVSPELMRKVEKQLETVITTFSIEEISVVTLAFFKTANRIRSIRIVHIIIDALMGSMNEINPITFVAILKAVNMSYEAEHMKSVKELLGKANEQRIWKKSFPIAAHLCNLGSKHNINVPMLIENVIQEMQVVQKPRLKDMTKVLLISSRFNHISINHNQVIDFYLKELRCSKRKMEIRKYPYCFLSCLLYLSYYEIYQEDLLNEVFSENFINLMKREQPSGFNITRELATLDCFVELDVPEYKGSRMNFKERFETFKRLQEHFPSNTKQKTFHERVTVNMLHDLQVVTNLPSLKLVHILPFMTEPVFLFISNGNRCFETPSKDIYALINRGRIVSPKDERNWIVVWPVKRCSYTLDTHVLMSSAILKLRHLKKLGFQVIEIDTKMYDTLTQKMQLELLTCKLKDF